MPFQAVLFTNSTLVRFVVLLNALSPIVFTVDGIVICVSLVQIENVPDGIDSMPSFKVTDVNCRQLKNTHLSNLTVPGMLIETIPEP